MNAFPSDTNDKLDVITFHQLDILADILIRETNSMHQEFLTKLEFVKDCIAQTVQNEQKIIEIDHFLKSLQLQIKPVEEELQLIENDLFACTKKVAIMEMPTCDLCQRQFTRKTNREEFMEIILTTASKMSKIYTLVPDMEAILKYEILPKNPYDAIFRLLNYHNNILCNTEKNLDLMLDKILQISRFLHKGQTYVQRKHEKSTTTRACP